MTSRTRMFTQLLYALTLVNAVLTDNTNCQCYCNCSVPTGSAVTQPAATCPTMNPMITEAPVTEAPKTCFRNWTVGALNWTTDFGSDSYQYMSRHNNRLFTVSATNPIKMVSMNLDGGDLQTVTLNGITGNGETIIHNKYKPSTFLVGTQEPALWAVNLDGSNPVKLLNTPQHWEDVVLEGSFVWGAEENSNKLVRYDQEYGIKNEFTVAGEPVSMCRLPSGEWVVALWAAGEVKVYNSSWDAQQSVSFNNPHFVRCSECEDTVLLLGRDSTDVKLITHMKTNPQMSTLFTLPQSGIKFDFVIHDGFIYFHYGDGNVHKYAFN